MTSTGFENYAEALKIYLAKYREVSLFMPFRPVALSLSLPISLFVQLRELTRPLLIQYFQSQSQRGENAQPRPSSSYGAAGAGSAGAGGPSAGATVDPSAATTYQTQEGGVNNILSPHGLDPSQQQPDPYGGVGGVYQPATTNNGVADNPY